MMITATLTTKVQLTITVLYKILKNSKKVLEKV